MIRMMLAQGEVGGGANQPYVLAYLGFWRTCDIHSLYLGTYIVHL